MKKDRFSKKKMIADTIRKIDLLENQYGFTYKTGWSQVDGRSESINRAYGRYDALTELLNDLSDGTL